MGILTFSALIGIPSRHSRPLKGAREWRESPEFPEGTETGIAGIVGRWSQ